MANTILCNYLLRIQYSSDFKEMWLLISGAPKVAEKGEKSIKSILDGYMSEADWAKAYNESDVEALRVILQNKVSALCPHFPPSPSITAWAAATVPSSVPPSNKKGGNYYKKYLKYKTKYLNLKNNL
jgi:hypothetical protein